MNKTLRELARHYEVKGFKVFDFTAKKHMFDFLAVKYDPINNTVTDQSIIFIKKLVKISSDQRARYKEFSKGSAPNVVLHIHEGYKGSMDFNVQKFEKGQLVS